MTESREIELENTISELRAEIQRLEGEALKTQPHVPSFDSDRPQGPLRSLREGDFLGIFETLLANAVSKAMHPLTTDVGTINQNVINVGEALHRHIQDEEQYRTKNDSRIARIEKHLGIEQAPEVSGD